MFDIHCHIIPDVDDGSDSFEESVKMAKLAYKCGTRAIVATPHSNQLGSYENFWNEKLHDKVLTLRKLLSENKIPLSIFCGQEIFCNSSTVDNLREGKLITINNSKYLLIEFDFNEYSTTVYRRIGQIIAEGYVPVIAHPERYSFVSEESDAVIKMKGMGALMQINKGSIYGGFGSGSRHNAYKMLNERLVDFVASDAHSPYMRTTDMSSAHEMISEMFSLDYAEYIFSENPRLLVANKKISVY